MSRALFTLVFAPANRLGRGEGGESPAVGDHPGAARHPGRPAPRGAREPDDVRGVRALEAAPPERPEAGVVRAVYSRRDGLCTYMHQCQWCF